MKLAKQRSLKAFWTVAALLVFEITTFSLAMKLLPTRGLMRDLYQYYQKSRLDSHPRMDRRADLQVWVSKRSGFYYCPSSQQYGVLTPGEFMTQGDAVQKGFRTTASLGCLSHARKQASLVPPR